MRSDGTWQANPSPYDNTIDFTIPKDNILGLHYSDIHDKSTREAIFAEPSPSVIGHPRRYFRIGQINNQNKAISAKIQREIVQYITGTHRALLKHYPKTAESRRETWRSWIDDGASANHYQQIHLPYIVTYFKDVWDTKFKEGDPLTPSILDKVKSEIVEMLVRMFIISDSKLEEYTRRRSVRNRSAIDAERDVEIVPRRIKRTRLTSTTISSPESPESEDMDEDDSALSLFNFGVLKRLWTAGEQKEVGRREVAFLAIGEGRTCESANREIQRHGGFPYSIDEYEKMKQMSRSDMGKKRGNFNKVKKWINNSLPFLHVRVREDQSLLEFARMIERINDGVSLPSEVMKDGQLTSESASIIRDILRSNPKISFASFTQLYNQFFVLLHGRAAKESEFPSIATVRGHICQLDNYDQHEKRESIKRFTNTPSPKGNRGFFGGGGDGTCHGKADKREVCMIAVSNNEYKDKKNPWKIDPSFEVTTAASPVGCDSVANSNHYLDSVEVVVPPESIASLLIFSLDNCTTAQKDGRLTVDGSQLRACDHGYVELTIAHGVTIRGFIIGDFFHRHQLSIKWFSETACGLTEKGCHEQVHHRQMIQADWDIYIRDTRTYMRLAAKILGDKAKDWMPHPMRELNTRWGSNCKACKNLLQGMYITNLDGDCFWVLLYKELASYYNDWRTGRLDALVTMFMMPELQVNCALEYEAGQFFEAHHAWHAMPGELTDRPGFRTLELPCELLDHAFPWWSGALADPESRFPETFKLFKSLEDQASAMDSDEDRKHLLDIVEMKKEQLEAGIKAGFDEMAKMQEDMFLPPLVFLLITHPRHGAGALRAILHTCQNGGLYLDTVYAYDETNTHLIDNQLTWSFLDPSARSEFEKGLYKKLEGKEEECIHFLRQFGLMQCKCRNEMKMITHERGTPRDVDSTTRLMDFASVHEQTFDALWSVFAYSMSATRIIEAAHGFQRESWDGQRSFLRNNAQLRYVMSVVYRHRQARRRAVYAREDRDEENDKKERKKSVKHHDRKWTCQMVGEQMMELKERYMENAIAERIPIEI